MDLLGTKASHEELINSKTIELFNLASIKVIKKTTLNVFSL